MDGITFLVPCIILVVFFVSLYLGMKYQRKYNEEKFVFTRSNLRLHEELMYKIGYLHAIKNKPMNFDKCLKDFDELKKEVEKESENTSSI